MTKSIPTVFLKQKGKRPTVREEKGNNNIMRDTWWKGKLSFFLALALSLFHDSLPINIALWTWTMSLSFPTTIAGPLLQLRLPPATHCARAFFFANPTSQQQNS
ncbi:hypothetical protein LSTR_LSTR016646 [Laodelphax striatellus]|uniref:Uncharacterized protein n=1 Tax=Laodelphax striatellus TaxID=195883 RepID=A0A482XTA9_LAOST|nr:hypothetical protein LSTR_LSTR016646 [Laodelphax striatellus]